MMSPSFTTVPSAIELVFSIFIFGGSDKSHIFSPLAYGTSPIFPYENTGEEFKILY